MGSVEYDRGGKDGAGPQRCHVKNFCFVLSTVGSHQDASNRKGTGFNSCFKKVFPAAEWRRGLKWERE